MSVMCSPHPLHSLLGSHPSHPHIPLRGVSMAMAQAGAFFPQGVSGDGIIPSFPTALGRPAASAEELGLHPRGAGNQGWVGPYRSIPSLLEGLEVGQPCRERGAWGEWSSPEDPASCFLLAWLCPVFISFPPLPSQASGGRDAFVLEGFIVSSPLGPHHLSLLLAAEEGPWEVMGQGRALIFFHSW